MTEHSYETLSLGDKELLDAAAGELINAYNPYNNQSRVAAAAKLASGEIIVGASMANASSTVNMCAERVAIGTANSQGHRDITAVALVGTDQDGVVENPVMPCGLCRQFMNEIVGINGKDISIICSNGDKTKIIKTSLAELLPLPYVGNLIKKND